MTKKYLYFHPITWYVIGYLVWMFIPPFFVPEGHHWETVLADFVGFVCLLFGYLLGATAKKEVIGSHKFSIRPKNVKYLIIALLTIIYGVRIKLYSEVGVYAFLHPYSRDSSLLDTISTVLAMPYIVLVMTLWYTTKRRIYVFLFLSEVILFLIPQMARSYYITVPLYFMLIVYFFGNTSLRKLLYKASPVLLVGLVFVSLVGPFINSVRSYAQIREFDQGLKLDFSLEDKSTSFIINRLNVHGEAHNFAPIIGEAVRMDQIAFVSMFEKWAGITEDYEVNPTGISTQLGIMLGYGPNTATDFPRNLVLVNYPYPILALFCFNVSLGILMGIIYKLLFRSANAIFIMLWLPLIYAPMFGGGGAVPSTFVFQYIFMLCSLLLVFLWFRLIQYFFIFILPDKTVKASTHSSIRR